MEGDDTMNGEDQTIEVKGLGLEGRLRGKRLVNANSLLLTAVCALAALGYQHHASSEEQHKKQGEELRQIHEAMAENTYVLSLSQADREKLNIAMPDSLRRKVRSRE